MKNLVSICFLFVLMACQPSDEYNSKEISLQRENQPQVTAPGVVPGDIGLDDIALDTSSTWKEYDHFYKEKVFHLKDEHFYDNLQWMTINNMVLFSNFNQAPVEIKKFYLSEILNRKFINNPDMFLKMITSCEYLSEKEIAKAAFEAYMINIDHLKDNEPYRESHHEKYKNGYEALGALAFDRWGVPRYESM